MERVFRSTLGLQEHDLQTVVPSNRDKALSAICKESSHTVFVRYSYIQTQGVFSALLRFFIYSSGMAGVGFHLTTPCYFAAKKGISMNIALIGYGTMGREIDAVARQLGHNVVATYTSQSPLHSVSTESFLQKNINCCIDFSIGPAVSGNAEFCSRMRIPLIEGTTGWHEHKDEILEIVRKQGGTMVYGNNFSVGAQMFFRIVRRAARLMNAFPEYDVGIHETHHIKKKDAPSGTALTLAQVISSNLKSKQMANGSDHNTASVPNELNISSSRIGTVFGTHTVLFHSSTDEIELVHRAHNRSGFAQGAVLAAELIQDYSGVFSFEELVFEKSFTHH